MWVDKSHLNFVHKYPTQLPLPFPTVVLHKKFQISEILHEVLVKNGQNNHFQLSREPFIA